MMNCVTLMGRLTKDPEIRVTSEGRKAAAFSIACDRDFKNREGERQTDFFNLTAWEKTAEFLEKYFRKGDSIGVCGRLQARRYQDRNGIGRTAVEILAQSVYFAGSRQETAFGAQAAPPAPLAESAHPIRDPFVGPDRSVQELFAGPDQPAQEPIRDGEDLPF